MREMTETRFAELLELARLRVEHQEAFYSSWNHCMEIIEAIDDYRGSAEPMYCVNPPEIPPAEDIPAEGLSTEEALENAAETRYGYFQVMKYV